ncbi:MAG: hypothetical protein JXQ73_04210 [Phycisphaerae bacterium]|nr:hypothetical protein [Phycisphaerae bacterium]
MVRWKLAVVVLSVLCILGTESVLADFYDSFNDGQYGEDPNVFDIDDPCWTIAHKVGVAYAESALDGELRLYVQGVSFISAGLSGALVDYGDRDPNTSANWFTDAQAHYVVAKMRANPLLAGEGCCGFTILADYVQWRTYICDFQFDDNWFEVIYVTGTDFSQARGGHRRTDLDPNAGFWMVCQYDPGADPNDVNDNRLRAAAYAGDKYDWDGVWDIDVLITTAWDPNIYPPYSAGLYSLTSLCSSHTGDELKSDVKYDNIECRHGVFTNVSRTLDLTVINPQYGTVTIDPDLLADCNNMDPNDYDPPNNPPYSAQRRYTDGTEIVLVAEAIAGKSFKQWLILDPNYPGDANYASASDSNTVLYLTMDEDKAIEASFKCGSSMPLFLAVTLMALAVGVVVRRLT